MINQLVWFVVVHFLFLISMKVLNTNIAITKGIHCKGQYVQIYTIDREYNYIWKQNFFCYFGKSIVPVLELPKTLKCPKMSLCTVINYSSVHTDCTHLHTLQDACCLHLCNWGYTVGNKLQHSESFPGRLLRKLSGYYLYTISKPHVH